MTSSNPATAIATGVGLVFAGIFAGTSYGLTFWAVPALVLPSAAAITTSKSNSISSQSPASSPSHLVRQWRDIYIKGKAFGPVLAGIAAASWFYAASTFAKSTLGRNLHIAGALLFMSIAPYTLIVMARTNNELWRRAAVTDTGKELQEEELSVDKARAVNEYPSSDLLAWWAVLNFGRSLLPLAGAVCVAYGSLSSF